MAKFYGIFCLLFFDVFPIIKGEKLYTGLKKNWMEKWALASHKILWYGLQSIISSTWIKKLPTTKYNIIFFYKNKVVAKDGEILKKLALLRCGCNIFFPKLFKGKE
jgi:hypothetical protein